MNPNRTAACALLLAVLAAGPAAAAPGGALAKAEALIAGAEKAEAAALAANYCLPEPFSRSLAAGLVAGDADLLPLMSSGTAQGDLLMAYVCRGVAAGSPEACGELKGVPIVPRFQQMPSKSATHTFEFRCVANYFNILMSKAALARDPRLVPLCLENEIAHPVFLPGKAAEGCALLGAAHSDPAVCARLAPLLDPGATGCIESSRQLIGDASFCPSIEDPMNRDLCLGAAAYRAARARGTGACGDSAVCRLMAAPDAGVCRFYEDRLRRTLCPALAPVERARSSAELEKRLDEAERLLADEGVPEDRAADARRDALAERAARARLRLEPTR